MAAIVSFTRPRRTGIGGRAYTVLTGRTSPDSQSGRARIMQIGIRQFDEPCNLTVDVAQIKPVGAAKTTPRKKRVVKVSQQR